MLAADPNALVVVAAGGAAEADECLSGVAGFPRSGVRDVDHIGIVGRDGDAHSTGTAAADAAVAVNEFPRFPSIIGTVNTPALPFFHRGVYPPPLTWRNRKTDAAAAGTRLTRQ